MEEQTSTTESGFGITITARLRHAALWKARSRFGSNQKLAVYLGISPATVGQWLNLSKKPKVHRLSKRVRRKLMHLTGENIEDLFPAELMTNDFLDACKEFEQTRYIEPSLLADAGALRCLPLPDQYAEQKEREEVNSKALLLLPARTALALRLYYGLGGGEQIPVSKIAKRFGVVGQRVRQMLSRGTELLRKYRLSSGLHALHTGQEPPAFLFHRDPAALAALRAKDLENECTRQLKKRKIPRRQFRLGACPGSGMIIDVDRLAPSRDATSYFRYADCPHCRRRFAVPVGTLAMLPHANELHQFYRLSQEERDLIDRNWKLREELQHAD